MDEYNKSSRRKTRAERQDLHLGATCKRCRVCPIAGKCYRWDIVLTVAFQEFSSCASNCQWWQPFGVKSYLALSAKEVFYVITFNTSIVYLMMKCTRNHWQVRFFFFNRGQPDKMDYLFCWYCLNTIIQKTSTFKFLIEFVLGRCVVCADYHLCHSCYATDTHTQHSFQFRQVSQATTFEQWFAALKNWQKVW